MGALGFKHRQNIIYREDTLESRLSLLQRWKNEGTIEVDEYNELIKDCTPKQVLIDNERKYGKNSHKEKIMKNLKHTKDYARKMAFEESKKEYVSSESSFIQGYMKSIEETAASELLDALIDAKKILDNSPIQFSHLNDKINNAINKATDIKSK